MELLWIFGCSRGLRSGVGGEQRRAIWKLVAEASKAFSVFSLFCEVFSAKFLDTCPS
jgi:hypothetical protein